MVELKAVMETVVPNCGSSNFELMLLSIITNSKISLNQARTNAGPQNPHLHYRRVPVIFSKRAVVG